MLAIAETDARLYPAVSLNRSPMRAGGALSVKVFLLGDWFAPFFFSLLFLVWSQRLLSEGEHFPDCSL